MCVAIAPPRDVARRWWTTVFRFLYIVLYRRSYPIAYYPARPQRRYLKVLRYTIYSTPDLPCPPKTCIARPSCPLTSPDSTTFSLSHTTSCCSPIFVAAVSASYTRERTAGSTSAWSSQGGLGNASSGEGWWTPQPSTLSRSRRDDTPERKNLTAKIWCGVHNSLLAYVRFGGAWQKEMLTAYTVVQFLWCCSGGSSTR